jgi:hypothetical protein
MSHRMTLSVFAALTLAAGATSADAADLATQSRLGAVFAEPAVVGRAVKRVPEYEAPIIAYNQWPGLAWSRGGYNYDSRYHYLETGPYYGGPYETDSLRLPYACGLFGYC